MNTTVDLPPATDEWQHARRRALVFLIAVFALTVPAAYFHGKVLARWGDPDSMAAQLAAIQQIPAALGEWRYISAGDPISDRLIEQLELRGYEHRIYEQPATGQRVAMLLLVGPAGPLVRHPPEICYQTRANRLLSSRELVVATKEHNEQLRLLAYESAAVVDGDFLVAYGFGSRGNWDCPDSPRMTFGGRPVLLKLHVLTDLLDRSSQDGLVDFLQALLPQINALTEHAELPETHSR